MSLVFQKILVGYNFNERCSTHHNMNHLHVWEEYKNLCLEKINHGDDLYMIVWDNKTEQPKEVKYGSYSVNSFAKYASHVDALPEVIEKYEKWKSEKTRINLLKYRQNKSNQLIMMRRLEHKVIVKYDLSIKRLREIYSRLGYGSYVILILYINRNFRNITKKELHSRILKYFRNQLSTLSYRDMQLLQLYSSENSFAH